MMTTMTAVDLGGDGIIAGVTTTTTGMAGGGGIGGTIGIATMTGIGPGTGIATIATDTATARAAATTVEWLSPGLTARAS
jgi:hypothetical protein